MKSHHYRNNYILQRGMTLLEVIVTLGVLSVIMIGSLSVYSSTYKTIRTREALLHVIHDANQVLSVLGSDIRRSCEYLPDYQHESFQHVVAAFRYQRCTNSHVKERVIVYALDGKHPQRLIRSIITPNSITSAELSQLVQRLEILPRTHNLLEIQIHIKDQAAGQAYTLQTSASYALRT